MGREYIGGCIRKGKQIEITRDQHGKFYVKNDGIITQSKLNATEVVCWLLHAINDEL